MAAVERGLGPVVQERDHLPANLTAAVAGVELAEGLGHISDHCRGRHRDRGLALTDHFDDAGEACQHRVGEGCGGEGRSVV